MQSLCTLIHTQCVPSLHASLVEKLTSPQCHESTVTTCVDHSVTETLNAPHYDFDVLWAHHAVNLSKVPLTPMHRCAPRCRS